MDDSRRKFLFRTVDLHGGAGRERRARRLVLGGALERLAVRLASQRPKRDVRRSRLRVQQRVRDHCAVGRLAAVRVANRQRDSPCRAAAACSLLCPRQRCPRVLLLLLLVLLLLVLRGLQQQCLQRCVRLRVGIVLVPEAPVDARRRRSAAHDAGHEERLAEHHVRVAHRLTR